MLIRNKTLRPQKLLNYDSLSKVWHALLFFWTTAYTGFPGIFKLDQGSVFSSQSFKALLNNHRIKLKIPGIEFDNSIGAGEKFHEVLWLIYQIVKMDFHNYWPKKTLKITTTAMNGAMNKKELVPSLLVLVVLPCFPSVNSHISDPNDRMKAIICARREIESFAAQDQLQAAVKLKTPSDCNTKLNIGDVLS